MDTFAATLVAFCGTGGEFTQKFVVNTLVTKLFPNLFCRMRRIHMLVAIDKMGIEVGIVINEKVEK